MKVLLVNKFHYRKGGSETYYFALAEALKAQGHEVVFFAMQDEKNLPCEQERYFVKNASVGGGFKSKLNMVLHIAYSQEAYRKMSALLEAEKPDLVVLNLVHKQLTCSVIDAIKKYRADLPVFWTMHDLICVCPSYTMLDGNGNICEKCMDGDFGHCLKNKCAHGSALMSALSAYEAKQIKKRGWYNQVDLFICPSEFYKNKLEAAKFTKSDIICMRNPLPLDTDYAVSAGDGKYVLYFGRLSKEKGVKTLIDAMKNTDYPLVILGTGPEESALKNYVVENGIKNVSFEGFKQGEELDGFVRGARCAVLPSEWYENGPYSAMEAMAKGKPLIVSSLGGLPELVEDGVNGYVYSSKEELAEAIEKMIALDSENYATMCERALEKARAAFDPKAYANRIVALAKNYGKKN